nr:hypothetical protein [Tanacetum cinerariifolium]
MKPTMSDLNHQIRNWLELPYDITANILLRIGMIYILKNAQKVCTLWRKICKDSAMWRVINMNDLLTPYVYYSREKLCKHVIDRSQGQLVDITFVYDYNDALLQYVADRISKETIETVARRFPNLKTLKVNQRACKLCVGDANEDRLTSYNEIAVAIGGSLHELRHLELIGNKMSNIGLQVILDGCHHLETLDLRECFYVVTRCLKQINHLKLPTDYLESYPYVCERHNTSYDGYVDDPEVYDGYISQ